MKHSVLLLFSFLHMSEHPGTGTGNWLLFAFADLCCFTAGQFTCVCWVSTGTSVHRHVSGRENKPVCMFWGHKYNPPSALILHPLGWIHARPAYMALCSITPARFQREGRLGHAKGEGTLESRG